MLRLYSLLLMGMVLASFGFAQDRDEHRWENVESLRVGQKLEVTTTQLRTIQGTYLNSSEAAIRLKTPEGEVSVMREEVFRVKSQGGRRKQNILVGVVVGALSALHLGPLRTTRTTWMAQIRAATTANLEAVWSELASVPA